MPAHGDIKVVALAALTDAGITGDQAVLQVELLIDAELRGVASRGMLEFMEAKCISTDW